jgi:hypothetical protein
MKYGPKTETKWCPQAVLKAAWKAWVAATL